MCPTKRSYTLRNLFEILLNQPEIRLYLPSFDWFGTANGHCPFAVPNQSENGEYNLISVWFNKILKKFLHVWVTFSSPCRALKNKIKLFQQNFFRGNRKLDQTKWIRRNGYFGNFGNCVFQWLTGTPVAVRCDASFWSNQVKLFQ